MASQRAITEKGRTLTTSLILTDRNDSDDIISGNLLERISKPFSVNA